jgi:hypothetical protein
VTCTYVERDRILGWCDRITTADNLALIATYLDPLSHVLGEGSYFSLHTAQAALVEVLRDLPTCFG